MLLIAIAVCVAAVPRLIEDAYNGHSHPILNSLIAGQKNNTLQYYIDCWFSMISWTAAWLITASAAYYAGFQRAGVYYSLFISGESVLATSILRFFVFSILATNIIWEDLPSIIHLPSEMRTHAGVMVLLHSIPQWEYVYQNEILLWLIKLFGAVLCLLAMAGLWSRVTIPLSALLATLHGGILREYSHQFHTCLLPLYLAYALALVEIVSNRRFDMFQRRGETESALYFKEYSAWLYHWCLLLVSISYTLAGWSKLWHGSWGWWKGENIKRIVMGDTLGPMHFEWGLDLTLANLPIWLYSVIGLFALFAECFYGLVLVSRKARLVFPVLAIMLHIGIWVAQGILFFDLILLQIAIICIELHRRELFSEGLSKQRIHQRQPLKSSDLQVHRRGCFMLVSTALFLVVVWRIGMEQFPLTGWRMYSGSRNDGWVDYRQIYYTTSSGSRRRADVDKWVGAMADARYRDILHKDKELQSLFFKAVGKRANELQRRQNEGDEIVSFEVERKRWNFLTDPSNHEFGEVCETRRFVVN